MRTTLQTIANTAQTAEFVGNPHIVAASRRDHAIQPPCIPSTFPEPLPPYLPRTAKIPHVQIPDSDHLSANAGRFSLSLRGMRKALRRSGNRAQVLVRNIEHVLVEWLWEGGTLLNPDSAHISDADVHNLVSHATCIGDLTTVLEVMRTPLQLVWYVKDDAFARYVIHCCARYHEVVSYSKVLFDIHRLALMLEIIGKEVAGSRLTYLLRPNVTRPDHRAPTTLDTPPVTDIDYSSHPDSEADILSDISEKGADSDMEVSRQPHASVGLSDIVEDIPGPRSVDASLADSVNEDPLLVQDDSDDMSDAADIDDSASEPGHITTQLSSLSIESRQDSPELVAGELGPDAVLQTLPQHAAIYSRQSLAVRQRMWTRSASSPSRSPARTMAYRRLTVQRRYKAPKSTVAALGGTKSQMFYDYLYS